MSKFKKAEKKKAKLRLGISGPSGSGKTFSALRLATGFNGKIAVIDTERGSASLYADKFEFDVQELTPPYSPERYIEAMNDAVKEGYDIIIMDSISHAWAGEGGVLNIKEKMDARGGNSFANWAKMTPIQERFIAALINCPAHIIVTMRSKQDHVQISEGGKTKIQKVGMAPIQREGFEYELTTVFDLAINHEAECSKDRTELFVDKIFKITEDTGKQIKEWLESGSELKEEIKKVNEVREIEPQKPQKEFEPTKTIPNVFDQAATKKESYSPPELVESVSKNCTLVGNTEKTKSEIKEKQPEMFPDKTKILISREQAGFLFVKGYTLGFSKDEIITIIYNLTKKIKIGELNNSELELIIKFLNDNKK